MAKWSFSLKHSFTSFFVKIANQILKKSWSKVEFIVRGLAWLTQNYISPNSYQSFYSDLANKLMVISIQKGHRVMKLGVLNHGILTTCTSPFITYSASRICVVNNARYFYRSLHTARVLHIFISLVCKTHMKEVRGRTSNPFFAMTVRE